MAKYEDYVQKDDELENEINEAAQESADRQESGESGFVMPERFQGKSPEEIAKAYSELEKLNSRQAQDLGQMRKTVDEFLTLQSDDKPKATPAEKAPVTLDDIYEDTDSAIKRGAEEAVGGRIEALERQLAEARLQSRVSELDAKFEGWRDQVQTPEFVNWINEKPYRARLAQAADAWDLDAAEELLSMYSDATGRSGTAARAKREKQLRDASLESGSAHVPPSEQTFSRTELMRIRVAARHGDSEAADWLKANGDAIAVAYEQGNITD